MALERSVLNEESIRKLLHRHYGIKVREVHKLRLGTANCYRVNDGKKNYFLKELQSSISKEAIMAEAELLEYLASTDVPVTRFYKTADGSFTIRYQDHVICLEEYIEGETYGYDELPRELLPKVAGMLGKLHFALRTYPLHVDMSDEWLNSFSAEKTVAEYDALIDVAKAKGGDAHVDRIVTDLEYKKQLAVRCEDYKKYYSGITYCASHGDYQGCQMIFAGGEICAVIDFSAARTIPVTWEIMRSFVQSSEECRDSATVNVYAFCEYVSEYMKYAPLTRADMAAMPYVYLFQLARSKYGYPQYLSSDSEEKERLLNFAFWRTDMCRDVEKNADAISERLLALLN